MKIVLGHTKVIVVVTRQWLPLWQDPKWTFPQSYIQ